MQESKVIDGGFLPSQPHWSATGRFLVGHANTQSTPLRTLRPPAGASSLVRD